MSQVYPFSIIETKRIHKILQCGSMHDATGKIMATKGYTVDPSHKGKNSHD